MEEENSIFSQILKSLKVDHDAAIEAKLELKNDISNLKIEKDKALETISDLEK